VDVKDDEGKKVRVCIDAKHVGNYMRFANHRDSKFFDIFELFFSFQSRVNSKLY